MEWKLRLWTEDNNVVAKGTGHLFRCLVEMISAALPDFFGITRQEMKNKDPLIFHGELRLRRVWARYQCWVCKRACVRMPVRSDLQRRKQFFLNSVVRGASECFHYFTSHF